MQIQHPQSTPSTENLMLMAADISSSYSLRLRIWSISSPDLLELSGEFIPQHNFLQNFIALQGS